jgi:PRTRC genetic system ThiF family protein
MDLDLRYLQAATVMPVQAQRTEIIMVGAGGTGSWLAPHLARLVKVLGATREISLTFVDPDHIEEANLDRQNFCRAELGRNKAQALAYRYSAALGLPIKAMPLPFTANNFRHSNGLVLLIGCVDNAKARQSLTAVLELNGNYTLPYYWWLDCGNYEDGGQVLLGSSGGTLATAFHTSPWCTALPSPAVQHPELLIPRPEETPSCEDMAIRNVQSLTVNQQVASVASDYTLKFLSGKLKKFATYFDLGSGVMTSRYATPEELAKVLAVEPKYFDKKPSKRVKVAV